MNWEALGAVGELLGALLLLGSLIYVGVQIRDAKRQMAAAGAQARSDALRDLWKLRTSPEYLDAHLKSLDDSENLSDKERYILGNWFFMYIVFMQNNYYQREMGMLEDSQSGALDSMPLLTESYMYREIWERLKLVGVFSEEFQRHVDGLIASRDT